MSELKEKPSLFSGFCLKPFYIFLIFIFLTSRNYSLVAQVSRLDSLETFLAESNPDSKRILILDDLVDELINVDLDRAISYAHEALDLSRKLEDKEKEVNALYKLGLAIDETSDRKTALKYFKESEVLAEKTYFYEIQAKSLMKIARYYRYVTKDSTRTVTYLLKSIEVSKASNYIYGCARSYAKLASFYTKYNEIDLCESYLELAAEYYTMEGRNSTVAHYYNEVGDKIWGINPQKSMDFYLKGKEYSDTPKLRASLAKAYCFIGEHETALQYLKEAIPHFRKKEKTKRMLGIAIAQIAEVYLNLNNFKEANKYCDEGIALLNNLGRTDQRAIPTLYRLKGVIAEHEGNEELALGLYTKSLDEAKRLKIGFEKIKSTSRIGVFYSSRDPQKGKILCQEAYKKAKDNHFTNLEVDACDCLYNIYKQEKSYVNALKFHEQKILLTDSLSTSKVVHALEINSKIAQKDKLLAEQSYLKEIKEKENRFQKLFIGFLLIAFLFGLMFMGFLMRSYRKISGQHKEIIEQTDQLENLNKRLEGSNEELKRFAHITSHDLKTPLRNIVSYTGLLRRYLKDDDRPIVNDSLNFIEKNGKRMNQLINDVLDYSKLSSQVVKKTENIDLGELVDEISQFSKDDPSGKQVIFEVSELPIIHWHSSKMFLLFKNIIENGIKYNESDIPKIKINGNQTTDGYIIHFQDNGIGIEKEYFDKIFVMFNRLHNQNQYEGTGLGLAVCKKIVNEFEGNININSEPGEGTTFIIKFPNHLIHQRKDKKELILT